jgi:hypothetical protein
MTVTSRPIPRGEAELRPGLAQSREAAHARVYMSAEKLVASPESGNRRMIANVLLAAVWIYVAMIGLLALDQQFKWGIF